jgi:DNA-binding protein HU-beta
MKKQDLIQDIHTMLGGTKVQAEQVVNHIFDAITLALKKGMDVDIAGFGKFQVKERAARMARNPKTGETVSVPASKAPKFKAGKALKDAVQ